MENKDQLREEQSRKPENFQHSSNSEEQKDKANQSNTADTEEAGYTPGETKFADGEGTRLDRKTEESADDQDSGSSDEQDADFENPEDDPA